MRTVPTVKKKTKRAPAHCVNAVQTNAAMEWDLANMGNGWVRQTEITADKLKNVKLSIILPGATVLGTDFQHTLKYITALSLWRQRLACAVCCVSVRVYWRLPVVTAIYYFLLRFFEGFHFIVNKFRPTYALRAKKSKNYGF